jgi:uncharacterized protein (DUF1800 family)
LPIDFSRLAVALCTALSLASASGTPAPAQTLGYDDARHLLNRTGFGATQSEVEHFARMTREEATRKLLADAHTVAITPPPAWVGTADALRYPRAGEKATDAEKKMFVQQQVREGLELRGWWVGEMLVTPSPLTERMTLFWHNHFVSSQQKVKLADLMYRQNVTLRGNALGNFGDMLHAIARDPAMVIYLDSAQNRKGTPNENFAREVMELFTLGEGNYAEQDIKEAARAFTGWSIDRNTGEFVFRRFIHDGGSKTVLGRSGNLDGDQVLDILLAQPQTAEFITRKLWRDFVSPDPDETEVKRIARRFRDSRYDIKVALYALLTSDAFYARGNRATLIKSPVELVVGALRQFELKPSETLPFAVAAAGMGQNLFSPPNVKGWPGQDTWINASTLLARKQFLDRVFRADHTGAKSMVPTIDGQDMAMAPKQVLAPAGAQDPDKLRQIMFRRAMDRGLNSASSGWRVTCGSVGVRQRASAPPSTARQWPVTCRAESLSSQISAPLAMVRGIVLDVTYQLKYGRRMDRRFSQGRRSRPLTGASRLHEQRDVAAAPDQIIAISWC